MNDRTHGASTIKTLRLALGPGASAITQLAAAMVGRGRARAISMDGFFFPYSPGFPILACPGRKTLAPAFARRPMYR
jgi:hypothetical protein